MENANNGPQSDNPTSRADLLKRVETLEKALRDCTQRAQRRYQEYQAARHELRRAKQALALYEEQLRNKEHEAAIVYGIYQRELEKVKQADVATITERQQQEKAASDEKAEIALAELRKRVDDQARALAAATQSEKSAKDEASALHAEIEKLRKRINAKKEEACTLRAENERLREESSTKDKEIQYLKMDITKRSNQMAHMHHENQQLRKSQLKDVATEQVALQRGNPKQGGLLNQASILGTPPLRGSMLSTASGSVHGLPAQNSSDIAVGGPDTPRKNNRLQLPSQSPEKPNTLPQYNPNCPASATSPNLFAAAGYRTMEHSQSLGNEAMAALTPHMPQRQRMLSQNPTQRSSSIVSPQPLSARHRPASILSSQYLSKQSNEFPASNSHRAYMRGYSGNGSQSPMSSNLHQSVQAQNTMLRNHTPQIQQPLQPQRSEGYLSSSAYATENPMTSGFHDEINQYMTSMRTGAGSTQNASHKPTSGVINLNMTPNTASGYTTGTAPASQYTIPKRNEQSANIAMPQMMSNMKKTLAMVPEQWKAIAQQCFRQMQPENGVDHSKAQCEAVYNKVKEHVEMDRQARKNMHEQPRGAGQQVKAAQMESPQVQQPIGPNNEKSKTSQTRTASTISQVQLQDYLIDPALQGAPQTTTTSQPKQRQVSKTPQDLSANCFSGVACLECHRSWANEWCDHDEPCENCQAADVECVRPPCEHADRPRRECPKGNKCNRAHSDSGYTLAPFKKDLKRRGKRDDDREWPVKKRRVEGGEDA